MEKTARRIYIAGFIGGVGFTIGVIALVAAILIAVLPH